MKESNNLQHALEDVQRIIEPLREGKFSERLNKVSIYITSISKSLDALHQVLESSDDGAAKDQGMNQSSPAKSKVRSFGIQAANAIKFTRMNVDATMVQALEETAKKPRSASKTNEQKKALALQRAFDHFPEPTGAMLEHYRSTSDPLDKYLVAGPWGFEYLRKRKIDLETYYGAMCSMLACQDSAAGRIVLSYSKLNRAINVVEEKVREETERAGLTI